MDVNKMINEFQNLNTKITTYENERNNLLSFIKSLEKDNKKTEEKSKKEKDTFSKEYYRFKIAINKYYINKLKSIISVDTKSEATNDKTM